MFLLMHKCINVNTSSLMPKQTILHLLDYSSILVNRSTHSKIKELQPLQSRAIKKILGWIGNVQCKLIVVMW